MRDSDSVGVTFVNTVIGRGTLNEVINLAFSTFNFTPMIMDRLMQILLFLVVYEWIRSVRRNCAML